MTSVFRELFRLFVDDGALALTIVAIVASAVIANTFLPAIVTGAILWLGCPLALLLNTQVAARRRRR